MKIRMPELPMLHLLHSKTREASLVVLLASHQPGPDLLEFLSGHQIVLREAFTTRGVLQNLSGVNLVILDDPLPLEESPAEVMLTALERSGIPFVGRDAFMLDSDEWLSRARLAGSRQITFLPPRQINLMSWAGGVGKTTLALAICRSFVQRTGLPAALLELSMGASALQARLGNGFPEFFSIATQQEKPALWHGVSIYPMDGRTVNVLLADDPGRLDAVLTEIRQRHTLFVVDGFPGHPFYPKLARPVPGLVNLVIASPREDTLMQARRLMDEVSRPAHLVLNMSRSLADRAEPGVDIIIYHHEARAQTLDFRLADPILKKIYSGWGETRIR